MNDITSNIDCNLTNDILEYRLLPLITLQYCASINMVNNLMMTSIENHKIVHNYYTHNEKGIWTIKMYIDYFSRINEPLLLTYEYRDKERLDEIFKQMYKIIHYKIGEQLLQINKITSDLDCNLTDDILEYGLLPSIQFQDCTSINTVNNLMMTSIENYNIIHHYYTQNDKGILTIKKHIDFYSYVDEPVLFKYYYADKEKADETDQKRYEELFKNDIRDKCTLGIYEIYNGPERYINIEIHDILPTVSYTHLTLPTKRIV